MTAAVDLTTLDGRNDAIRALARECARARALIEKMLEAVCAVGDAETVARVHEAMRDAE